MPRDDTDDELAPLNMARDAALNGIDSSELRMTARFAIDTFLASHPDQVDVQILAAIARTAALDKMRECVELGIFDSAAEERLRAKLYSEDNRVVEVIRGQARARPYVKETFGFSSEPVTFGFVLFNSECPYCAQRSPRDKRGGCLSCGAPKAY